MKTNPKKLLSLLLLTAVGLATSAALVNCKSAVEEEEEESPSEDAITGVNNTLGLGLRYDEKTGTVHASLNTPLQEGQKLYVRVRRGKLEIKEKDGKALTPSQQVDCSTLSQARPIEGSGDKELNGKVVYQGPKVDKSLFDLVNLYNEGWADDTVPRAEKDEVKRLGPTPIVEACIMKNGKPAAKLATNLAYAWDQNTKAEGQNSLGTRSIHINAPDGGNGGPAARGVTEENVNSQIEYGQLCVEQLGEIPFFKKIGNGKYDTFDCRDLVGTNADGPTGAIPGVEGARIPATVDGVVQTKCSPGRELGLNSESYGCLNKADHGMFLASGETQPGPMVVTAKNDKGTHWILLCRKVADDGTGMMNTKVFNDVAMIGHNPRTGRTCFFQNDIGTGRDGKHVPHPADVEKSTTMWSTGVQEYCSGTCHAESAFVHSPWIDGAKRSDGKAIVPKMGELADFPISELDRPYNIVAADKLGFELPKQLVSDEVGACNNCHRLAGGTLNRFAKWSTGSGTDYYNWITETGKKFEASHWMPPRKDGLTADNFAASPYGKALQFMDRCIANANAEGCIWADVPRGEFNNPAVRP